MSDPRLARDLYASLVARLGAGEHVEIAGLIRDAEKVTFDPRSSDAVGAAAWESPWSVESNADLIEWPTERPAWIELPFRFKGAPEGENPVLGFLVAPHVEHEGLWVVMTAFMTDQASPQHCFAVALVDVAALAENAYLARRMYSRTRDDSLDRMMSLVGVTMSPEFEDELMITADGRHEVVEALMRDATAHFPTLLAAMIAKRSVNATTVTIDGTATLSLSRLRRPSGAGRLIRSARKLPVWGFDRIPAKRIADSKVLFRDPERNSPTVCPE